VTTGSAGQADGVLVGHAERERVILALKDAFVQGRLTKDELAERAGGALTARTGAELAALIGDIPGDLVAGPTVARPLAAARPSLVQRRPVVWAIAGSGSCMALAFGAIMLAAHVLDPNGLGNPYHPWSNLCGLVAFVAIITGLGILIHGLGTAEDQRRARRQIAAGRRLGPVR
jgi:DUF1707 SHOCT-like domain